VVRGRARSRPATTSHSIAATFGERTSEDQPCAGLTDGLDRGSWGSRPRHRGAKHRDRPGAAGTALAVMVGDREGKTRVPGPPNCQRCESADRTGQKGNGQQAVQVDKELDITLFYNKSFSQCLFDVRQERYRRTRIDGGRTESGQSCELSVSPDSGREAQSGRESWQEPRGFLFVFFFLLPGYWRDERPVTAIIGAMLCRRKPGPDRGCRHRGRGFAGPGGRMRQGRPVPARGGLLKSIPRVRSMRWAGWLAEDRPGRPQPLLRQPD